jgi:hypothetical protein
MLSRDDKLARAVERGKLGLHASALAAEGKEAEARRLFLQLFAEYRADRREAEAATLDEQLQGLCAQLGCLLEAGEQDLAAVLWQEALTVKRRAKMDDRVFNAITSKLRERRRYGSRWRKPR